MKNSLLVHKHLIVRAEAIRPPVDEEQLKTMEKSGLGWSNPEKKNQEFVIKFIQNICHIINIIIF